MRVSALACIGICRCVNVDTSISTVDTQEHFIRIRERDRKRERGKREARVSGLIDGDDNRLVEKGGTDETWCFISVSK